LGPLTKVGESTVNANYQHGAQIRRNSAISILNSVFAGYVDGVYIDDTKETTANSTYNNFVAGRLVFQNNIILGSKNNEIKGEKMDLFKDKLKADNVFNPALFADAVITDPFKFSSDFASPGTPNFTVKAGSIAAAGALYTDAKLTDAFFEKVAYKGAVGTTDWTAGWANFDPQTMPYTTPGAVTK